MSCSFGVNACPGVQWGYAVQLSGWVDPGYPMVIVIVTVSVIPFVIVIPCWLSLATVWKLFMCECPIVDHCVCVWLCMLIFP